MDGLPVVDDREACPGDHDGEEHALRDLGDLAGKEQEADRLGQQYIAADGWDPAALATCMDALTRGTADGLKLFLNILAMLLVFVALVHLANAALGLLPDVAGNSSDGNEMCESIRASAVGILKESQDGAIGVDFWSWL